MTAVYLMLNIVPKIQNQQRPPRDRQSISGRNFHVSLRNPYQPRNATDQIPEHDTPKVIAMAGIKRGKWLSLSRQTYL